MTTEVAVLNSGAIALAADSAVTIGNGKVYNSAIKLFTLCNNDPVGVMIYGNSTIMDFPWDIIIKSYKNNNEDNTCNSLEEYARSFINHIDNNDVFLSTEVQHEHLLKNTNNYLLSIFYETKDQIKNIYKEEGNTVSKIESDDIFYKTVQSHFDKLSSRADSDGFDKNFFDIIYKKHKKSITEIIKYVFQRFNLKTEVINKLIDISILIITKDHFNDSSTGIVIAGYGSDDYFPAVETYEVEGIYENRVKQKRLEEKSQKLLRGNQATIIPFAQHDMIATFMEGINPYVQDYINSYIQTIFNKLHKIIDRKHLKGTEKEISETIKRYTNDIDDISKDFFYNLYDHIGKYHSEPVLQMVSALPKEDLAIMAETLVSLTAFKRKMTYSPETVGGPIDVAVISKTDGFVWIKRKHYFPKDLNYRYLQKYNGV